ncbi:MAG: hypothetical protein QIT35_gp65 [Methanophagales virus PBV299]|uniref:Uncharacterized protein n=1 Tax=Methanophagales virus PBV299 TaxID=2987730 RepID=A0ABY6GLZ9_9CAUD|nr:MAG: hypothetical protein QIT35_gp65 [Methanophagales virus PBV299]UYL64861.1 MAG: hypothetical protein OFDIEDLO_00065 [Methanophagales virus PBV299]
MEDKGMNQKGKTATKKDEICPLCKYYDGQRCQHPDRAFFKRDEACHAFSPKSVASRKEYIEATKRRQQISQAVSKLLRAIDKEYQRKSIDKEGVLKAAETIWIWSRYYQPVNHPSERVEEARKAAEQVSDRGLKALLLKVVREKELYEAYEVINKARVKMIEWTEAAKQVTVNKVSKLLSGDDKVVWDILTSNDDDFEKVLKARKPITINTRRAPMINPYLKRFINLLLINERLPLEDVPPNVADELIDRELATIDEEAKMLVITEYALSLFL